MGPHKQRDLGERFGSKLFEDPESMVECFLLLSRVIAKDLDGPIIDLLSREEKEIESPLVKGMAIAMLEIG